MEITANFVETRATALTQRWGSRNQRMDDYERLYLLDVFEDEAEPDERRIAGPRAWNVVETFRTLLLTRPPVISVPPSEVRAVATDQADLVEKYLYGVWYQTRVMDALNLAEWYACALGEGVLRVVYDDAAVEDELPLLVQAVDPRTVYASPSGRPGFDLELVHQFKRPRREIEAEWGIELERAASDGEDVEAWLDGEVDYIEYWRVDVEEVEEEIEPLGADEEAEPVGALARLVAAAKRMLGGAGSADLSADLADEAEGGETLRQAQGETRTVRRRVVTHCVVVEGQFIKEPVVVPGYRRLPFIRYAGIVTPLADEDGALSVLFPITAGAGMRKSGTMGLVAAENQLLAMRQRIIETYANGALITDDKDLLIDFSPGSINYIRKGTQWSFLMPPGPHPAVDGQIQLVEKLIQDATVSAAMQGRYVGTMSGLALSAVNNPVLMRIAHRQQIRERAYEMMNTMILQLSEEYAPPEGWYVWGVDRRGASMELKLQPNDIGGYYRNRVELSASLPKDEAGEVMSLAQLVNQGLISRETFLDQLQRIKHLSSQSPQDEMKKILRDKLLFDGPTAEKLAQVVLSDYSTELAQALGVGAPPAPSPGPPMPGPGGPPMGPGPGGPPQMMGPPGGPMGGIPPGVVPPQAVPQAVGGNDLGAMLAMMGQPPPEGVG